MKKAYTTGLSAHFLLFDSLYLPHRDRLGRHILSLSHPGSPSYFSFLISHFSFLLFDF